MSGTQTRFITKGEVREKGRRASNSVIEYEFSVEKSGNNVDTQKEKQ